MTAWLVSTNSRGVTSAWSASTRMGVPCSSDPLTMSTSCPAIRMYRLKTSEGTPNPATWPRWRGPLAYGQATAERTFMGPDPRRRRQPVPRCPTTCNGSVTGTTPGTTLTADRCCSRRCGRAVRLPSQGGRRAGCPHGDGAVRRGGPERLHPVPRRRAHRTVHRLHHPPGRLRVDREQLGHRHRRPPCCSPRSSSTRSPRSTPSTTPSRPSSGRAWVG